MISGEFHFGSVDRGMFGPGMWRPAPKKGAVPPTYLKTVLNDPAFVGCHRFHYVDHPLTGRLLDGENYHIRFVSVTDLPYREFMTAVRRASLEATAAGQ